MLSGKVAPLETPTEKSENLDDVGSAPVENKSPNLAKEEEELFDKFIKQLGIEKNEYGHYCFVEEGIDAAYEQFESIQLGAIDIILCPDKSLISRKFTNICIIIKIFEYLLMYYSFACVPISNNPFLNGFKDTSISSGDTTYSPLSIILIFAFVYYVLLTLQTGVRNSMLMVTTKDFAPQKNWKYYLKITLEIVEIAVLVSLCFFALSTYIYDYDLELIFNGMAVIFIAEFDEMSVDLYLHGNSKRTAYYHKLICLSYVKVNYTCVNAELKKKLKNIDQDLAELKEQKKLKAIQYNNEKAGKRLVKSFSKQLMRK